MKYFIALQLLVLCFSSIALAELKVNVTFIDRNDQPTSVQQARFSKVLLAIDGLDSKDAVYADLWIRPLGTSNSERRIEFTNWKLKTDSNGMGRFFWSITLPSDAFEPHGNPLWQVQVQWRTEKGLSGLASDVVYLAGQVNKKYFEVLGPEICSFPSSIEAESGWMQNTSGFDQNISMQLPTQLTNISSGVDLDQFPELSNSMFRKTAVTLDYGPLGGSKENLGWFFPGWNQVMTLLPGQTITRVWHLPPGAGGVTAKRLVFHKFSAREWTLTQGGWTLGRTGVLDVAVPDTGFYIVPEFEIAVSSEVSNSSTRSNELLKRINLTLNDTYTGSGHCGKALSELRDFSTAEKYGGQGNETPLYFRAAQY